jgi:hypothetical protein
MASLLPLVRIWIFLSVLASVAGWSLSAAGQLNPAGYALAAAAGLGLIYRWRGELLRGGRMFAWHRLRRRFTRPLPLAFAGLAALVLLGGLLYAPNNYDALTYRLPRVLHWLDQGRWHWVYTLNQRMNDRSCGFEWLMAPVVLLAKSDRPLFLINFVPFLLLPGLVFSVLTRLGVRGRVAWHWMWLLPTGYNFLLQAGSVGNDSFAAVYALAAVDFARRAVASHKVSDLWFSLLAAALMTGAKSGNLPLLLPWCLVFVPAAAPLLARPLSSLAVAAVAGLVSFLPTALLNYHYCGDWSGLVLEVPELKAHSHCVAVAVNSAMFLLSNFAPTFFPWAGWWNQHALALLPNGVSGAILANFQSNFYLLSELPGEEKSGLGFGVSCLLAGTLLAGWRWRSSRPTHRLGLRQWLVLIAPYFSLCFFFAHSGMMSLTRLVSAYYPLLFPALLVAPAAGMVVRHRWWRWATAMVLLLAVAAVVLTPSRPLWPSQTILARANDPGAHSHFINRVKAVYSVYADRSDPLFRARAAMPEDCPVIGFAGGDNDTEISFWRPYTHRRVECILPGDSAMDVRARHIEYAAVGEVYLSIYHLTLQEWLQKYHATLLATVTGTMTVSDGPHQWYVVRLMP